VGPNISKGHGASIFTGHAVEYHLRVKGQQTFEMSETTHPLPQRHMPEDLNPQSVDVAEFGIKQN
jgi:hypothetical protein